MARILVIGGGIAGSAAALGLHTPDALSADETLIRQLDWETPLDEDLGPQA
ncbi:hypothetical protein ACGFYV_02930 [Streptomyces sp. NPDC048297]|uniref:hypothetical protein n=1 Tax=Streptomyces sp. NPDC048297 TaxID=3365531 RepID=UPI00371DB0D6